jgi:DNA-binding response OmpR family regulator
MQAALHSDALTVRFDGIVADLARREVRYHDGAQRKLSGREAALLRYFAANAGRVISRDELLSCVWQWRPTGCFTRTVDMYVSHLRRKLRDDARKPSFLFTVAGQGYLLANGHRAREANGG